MSLTRAQWNEMWKHIEKIEREVSVMNRNSVLTSRQFILSKTKQIKDLIQSVMGQME